MPGHEYFQELSSLALLGDLSAAELADLTHHLRECMNCQVTYFEFTELANQHLPLGYRRSGGAHVPFSKAARTKTLQRVAEEGLRISREAFHGPVGFRGRVAKGLDDLRWAIHARAVHLGVSVVVLTIVVVAGLVVRHEVGQNYEIEELRSNLLRTRDDTSQLQGKLGEAAQTQSRAATDTEHLKQQLVDTTARLAGLNFVHQQDLDVVRSLETRIEHLISDNNILAQHTTGNDAELATLRAQLDQARATVSDKDAQLVASQFQLTELSNQLKGQEAALEREQQLLVAGRDIRDLMGARNLHIIDVHDMDARGESRPFGRIFLTEGKKLIFYAYDLNTGKAKNVSFQAWGERDDGSRTAVNLGILFVDDQKQSRWALKVEDPNILKAIDSVFVTLEPHGGTAKPTGRKLMYAYLQNPINHP